LIESLIILILMKISKRKCENAFESKFFINFIFLILCRQIYWKNSQTLNGSKTGLLGFKDKENLQKRYLVSLK
jgi:hypothetical protein